MLNRIILSGTIGLMLLAAGCSTSQRHTGANEAGSASEMNPEKSETLRTRHKRERNR